MIGSFAFAALRPVLQPLLIGAAVAATVFAGVQTWRLHNLATDYAQAQARHQQERAAAERAAHEAIAAYRVREQNLAAEFARLQGETRVQVERATRDAANARAALERLRHAARAAAAPDRGGAPPDTPTAVGGAPTAGAGLVLADVLGWCGARLVELGEFADRAHAAGLACERAYDAVTMDPP